MKRFIALLLALIMICGTFTSCADSNFRFKEDIMVSRGQWLEMLAENFGLTMYQQAEPYFSDINAEHPLFMYAQSAYEWEVMDTQGASFRPDDVASLEFVISTAVYAVDPQLDIEDGEDKLIPAMNFAIEKGIAPQNVDYQADVTMEQCTAVMQAAQDAYLNKETVPVNEVTYVDETVDMRQQEDSIEKLADGEYLVKGKKPAVGDVIIAPGTQENPDGEAIKIVSVIDNGDGTYTIKTSVPELWEVIDEVEYAGVVAPERDEIIPAEGVEIVSVTPSNTIQTGNFEKPEISSLGKSGELTYEQIVDGLDKDTPINIELSASFSSDGEVKASANFEDGTKGIESFINNEGLDKDVIDMMKETGVFPKKSDMSDRAYKDSTDAIEKYKNGEIGPEDLKKALEKEKTSKTKGEPEKKGKFESGYKITGTINITDLYVDLDYKLKTKKIFGVDTGIPVDIEELVIETNYNVEKSLSVEGSLKGELTLFKSPIPLGAVGSLTLEVKLVAELNGELSVKVTVGSSNKIEYKNGNFKQTTKKNSSKEFSVKVSFEVGPEFSATLAILAIPIIDAGVSASLLIECAGNIKYSTDYTQTGTNFIIERKTTIGYGVNAYIPIIKVHVGASTKTIAHKLGITATWNPVTKEKAHKIPIVEDTEYILWRNILELGISEPVTDESGKTVGYQIIGDSQITVLTYHIKLSTGESKEIGVNLPDGYTSADIVWTSKNPAVATVSGNTVTAVGVGSTNIDGVTTDGKHKVSCAVTVS